MINIEFHIPAYAEQHCFGKRLLLYNFEALFHLVLCLFIFIGHGPFSHLFDALFIPKARPDADWKVNVLQLLVFLPVICSLTHSASSSNTTQVLIILSYTTHQNFQ